MTRVPEPADCRDQSSASKAYEKIAAELDAYRAKYGKVELVERLYAKRLDEYKARIAELA